MSVYKKTYHVKIKTGEWTYYASRDPNAVLPRVLWFRRKEAMPGIFSHKDAKRIQEFYNEQLPDIEQVLMEEINA